MAGRVTDVFNVKQVEEAAAMTKVAFRHAMATASQALFNPKAVSQLEKRLLDMETKLAEARADRDAKLARATTATLHVQERMQAKFEADRAEDRLKALQNELKTELGNVERVAKKWEDAREKFGKNWKSMMAEGAESFGEGIESAFDALKGKDIKSLGNLFKKAGAGAAKGGEALGGPQKGGIAELLTKLGPLLTGIGAIALGFAALVKVVMDADSRIKDLNKEILSSGTSALDMGEDISTALTQVRDAFSGTGAIKYLDEFGTTTKENIAIMSSFAKSGLTYKELTGDINDQAKATERLRDANKAAIVYAKLLGESAENVATNMGEMLEETSTTLEGIRARYHEIAVAAKESGFDTKRFYGMVLQMTSGMSMYNVRLSETLGMLLKFGKIMGPKEGAEFAQSLKEGMRGMSTQDRIRTRLKVGGEGVQRIAKMEAVGKAENIINTMRDLQKDATKKAALEKALEDAGHKGGVDNLTPEKMAEALSKMSEDQMTGLMVDLNKVSDAFGTKLRDAFLAAQAGKGYGGDAAAMGSFGPMATLLTRNLESLKVLGKTVDRIDPNKETDRMFLESQGITPEMYEKMKLTLGTARVEYDRAGGQKGTGQSYEEFAMKYFQAKEKDDEEDRKKMEDEAKAKENAWKTDQELAKQVVENTRSMADRMENVIEQLLTSISEGINDLVRFFFGGQDKKTKEAKSAAIEDKQREIEGLTKKLSEVKGTNEAAKDKREELRARIQVERDALKHIMSDTKTEGTSADFKKAAMLDQLSPAARAKYESEKAALAKSRGKMTTDVMDLPGRRTQTVTSWEDGPVTADDEKEIQKKLLDEQMRREKITGDKRLKEEMDLFSKIMDDVAEKQQVGQMMAAVLSSGGKISQDQAMAALGAIRGGAGNLPPELAAIFKQPGVADAVRKAGIPLPQIQDGLIRVSSSGLQYLGIDKNDTLTAAKPNGALAKGTGTVNNYYIYDGGQALNVITKAQRAGIIP